MKKLELYWKNIDIGTLKETNWDMRSSGDIQFKFNFLDETFENNQLASFIKHSIKASCYLDEGDDKNFNRMCEEEELKYIHFINSSDWKLISENREEIKILCPIFHDNNEITWQIDLEK